MFQTSRASTRSRIVSLLAVPTLLYGCAELPDDASGSPSSTVAQISQAQQVTSSNEYDNAAAVASNGSVALWARPVMINGIREIQAQFMDVNGTAMLTPALRVSPNNGRNKRDVSLAAGPDGKFLLTYDQLEPTGRSLRGVILRLPSRNTPVFATSTFTIDSQPGVGGVLSHARAAFVSNVSKFFVAYNDTPSASPNGGEIQGNFVDLNGAIGTEFVVTSAADAAKILPAVSRVQEPEVAFAPSTGVILVTMESFGTERIFAATIPLEAIVAQPSIVAQAPMLLEDMHAAGTFFNQTSNRFGVAMTHDYNGKMILATLSPSCATNNPSSCDTQKSAPGAVTPRFVNGGFRNVAAAPLGAGMMVMTAQINGNSRAIDHHFFDSNLQLVKSQPLYSGFFFTTASITELSVGSRSVASSTLPDSGGNVTEYLVTTPPSNYVFQSNF